MKKSKFLLGSVAVLGFTLVAGWLYGDYKARTTLARHEAPVARLANPAPFVRATDCFAKFPSYDAWWEFLRAKNGWWDPRLLLLKAKFPREPFEQVQANVDCRMVAYESDGVTVPGFVLMPRDAGGRKLPLLVYNRGGNGSYGAITFAAAMDHLAPFAQEGFIVVASQYRGSHDDEKDPADKDEFGGRDVGDVLRLLELAKRIPNADPENLFMLGASRGAMMSYMAARRTDDIKAMAIIAGVSDLRRDLVRDPRMEPVYVARIPGWPGTKEAALAERSVMAWANQLPRHMPVLLLHGGADERVHVSQATELHEELDRLRHPNKLVVYPGDNHGLHGNRARAVAEIVAWFRAAMREPPTGGPQPAGT